MAVRKIPTCKKCGFQIGSYDHVEAHRGKPVMGIKSRHAMSATSQHGFHALNDTPANQAKKVKLW